MSVQFISYFFLLFSYPLIRASSTAFFFEAYGAKSLPTSWVWAVAILSICITGLNQMQKKMGSRWLLSTTTFVSFVVFALSWLVFEQGLKQGAFAYFVWKEVYIVLLVHLMLAYTNSSLNREQFKKLIGWIGASGSLGSMCGGMVTTWMSDFQQPQWIFYLGAITMLIPGVLVFLTPDLKISHQQHETTPLASLDTVDVKRYVFLIILITILSQWIINIADFQFNLVFEKSITDPHARTKFLGQIYTYTNALSLAIQLLLIPLVFKRFKERSIQIGIPTFFLLSLISGLMIGAQMLWISSLFYLTLKAVDYSLFSAAKEYLYQPMDSAQKYATKYLTDMLAYRGGKGTIALFLVYVQHAKILAAVMIIFLLLWLAILSPLFRLHEKLFSIKG